MTSAETKHRETARCRRRRILLLTKHQEKLSVNAGQSLRSNICTRLLECGFCLEKRFREYFATVLLSNMIHLTVSDSWVELWWCQCCPSVVLTYCTVTSHTWGLTPLHKHSAVNPFSCGVAFTMMQWWCCSVACFFLVLYELKLRGLSYKFKELHRVNVNLTALFLKI